MELSVRDWMIIVGVLLIIAVLLDGYRRVRNERRGNIRMSLNKQFLNTAAPIDNIDGSCSELPSGRARSVERKNNHSSIREHPTIEEPTFNETLSAKDLDLEQDVPMLMESVNAQTVHYDASVQASSVDSPEYHASADQGDKHDSCSPESLGGNQQQLEAEKRLAMNVDDKEVVVINVVAKDEPFKGPDLLHILLACDVRFGEMNIFHRHEKSNGSGAVQFSVANSVEPGEFDLDTIDSFSTPGVCFFMSVPGPEKVIDAFDCLVETAQCLVKNLNGELRDESRSVMTAQTLAHCRQRLFEFERRQLALQV